jgi:hypothetical protein
MVVPVGRMSKESTGTRARAHPPGASRVQILALEANGHDAEIDLWASRLFMRTPS